MHHDRLWQALVEAIREETDNPGARIDPSMSANDVPGWDSLAHVRIVMNIEARTGLEIEISDTYKAATIDELHQVIVKRLLSNKASD